MITLSDGKNNIEEAKALITEYLAELGRDLSFQSVEEELADPAVKYTAPQGELVMAEEDGRVLGMVAYHRLDDDTCEMKRLFLRPEGRGRHIGEMLVREIVRKAENAGYRYMVLDTVEPLRAAVGLYKKLGFKECEAYYRNPMEDVIYMRKTLGQEET